MIEHPFYNNKLEKKLSEHSKHFLSSHQTREEQTFVISFKNRQSREEKEHSGVAREASNSHFGGSSWEVKKAKQKKF